MVLLRGDVGKMQYYSRDSWSMDHIRRRVHANSVLFLSMLLPRDSCGLRGLVCMIASCRYVSSMLLDLPTLHLMTETR